ncbi:MAG: hypothetical protein U1E83_06055 [Methylotetracoccus sp.]
MDDELLPATRWRRRWERRDELLRRIEVAMICRFGFLRAQSATGFRRRLAYVFPERPAYFHALYAILPQLGYRITTRAPQRADLFIHFEDVTVRRPGTYPACLHGRFVINSACDDIGKDRVEQVFQEVFGYGLRVDPRSHAGVCVRKSIANARHDGTILRGPTSPEPGYVYQRLVNNVEHGKAHDIRVEVMNGSIPFVVHRVKSLADRFDRTERSMLGCTEDVFGRAEIDAIKSFACRIGLDYGELDILRDRDDGRIYIVDANNTPSGPMPGGDMTRREYRDFSRLLSQAFRDAFIDGQSVS